jgi:hypothetical protein
MKIDPDIVTLFDAHATCPAPIGNYYGTPTLLRHDGVWYLALGTSHGTQLVAISDGFVFAWLDEFDGKTPAVVNTEASLIEHWASPWVSPEAESSYDSESTDDRAARDGLLDVFVEDLKTETEVPT